MNWFPLDSTVEHWWKPCCNMFWNRSSCQQTTIFNVWRMKNLKEINPLNLALLSASLLDELNVLPSSSSIIKVLRLILKQWLQFKDTLLDMNSSQASHGCEKFRFVAGKVVSCWSDVERRIDFRQAVELMTIIIIINLTSMGFVSLPAENIHLN